jgi:pimeloyl-ACP methyl ester carboxylesterase
MSKVEPALSNKLPDGVPFHARDHPVVPFVLYYQAITIIVLLLLSPFILLASIILVPLSFYTRSWDKKFLQKKIDKEKSVVIETKRGPIEYMKIGSAPYALNIPGGEGGPDAVDEKYAKELFMDRGLGMIAISRSGYRRTPISSGRTWEEQADLIASLLDVLDIKSVVVFAISGAGPSAVHFAARHPDKVAVLILGSCNLYPLGGMSKRCVPSSGLTWNIKLMYWVTESSLMSWMTCPKVPLCNADNPKEVEALIDQFIQVLGTHTAEQRKAEANRLMTEEPLIVDMFINFMPVIMHPLSCRYEGHLNDHWRQVWDMQLPFDEIDVPTVIFHGKLDNDNSFEHSEYAAKMIKGAQFFPIEEGHHIAAAGKGFRAIWEEVITTIKASKKLEPPLT